MFFIKRSYIKMKHINMSKDEYKDLLKEVLPPITKIINFVKAYVVGGVICIIGQALWDIYILLNVPENDAGTLGTITMIFIGSLLTGFGVYDEISQFAGAGALVPVTGFANAMVSPALEYKQEGLILGTGAKLFNIAGPVLTYGMVSAFVIGIIKIMLGG
jgi:stage V sporulation protein AC